ncbi:hypothetical protein LS72_001955, partial [Helicobacter apodemus]
MKNLNPSNKEIIVKSYTKDSTLKSKSNPKALDSQSFYSKTSKVLNPKLLDSNLNTKAINPNALDSKSNVKVYKDNPNALDSQSLIPQLFNPKFLDSNSNLKPLYSRINVKTYSNLLN